MDYPEIDKKIECVVEWLNMFDDKIKESDTEAITIHSTAWNEMYSRFMELLDPIYCPECGHCGENGCCTPLKCNAVSHTMCPSVIEQFVDEQEFYHDQRDMIIECVKNGDGDSLLMIMNYFYGVFR